MTLNPMTTDLFPTGLIDFFTYPRLFMDIVVGVDFGYIYTNRYFVLDTWINPTIHVARKQVEDLIMEWVESRKPDYPISICHETEPSTSKHLKTRGGQGDAFLS